jgi:hypothetical protein
LLAGRPRRQSASWWYYFVLAACSGAPDAGRRAGEAHDGAREVQFSSKSSLFAGAGAASRRDIGVTVFGGMLAATVIGIILIPGLFVLFERISEWRFGRGPR